MSSNLTIEEIHKIKKRLDRLKPTLMFHSQEDLEALQKHIPDIEFLCNCEINNFVEKGRIIYMKSFDEIMHNHTYTEERL